VVGPCVFVVVADVALADEGLKVRAELHAVGRVDVDHLHLAAEALVVQERVHHDERVAEDHPVDPIVAILVSPQDLIDDRMLRVAEQFKQRALRVALVADQRLDDRLGRESFMDKERKGRHVEREPLGLARPVEEGPAEGRQLAEQFERLGRGGAEGFVAGIGGQRVVDPRQPPAEFREQRLALLAGRVLTVPVERRGERGVIAVGPGRLLLLEPGLRADVGPDRAVGLAVPKRVARGRRAGTLAPRHDRPQFLT
jgi:hypothetical protein